MRKKTETWVVYLMPLHGKKESVYAVCSQSEWNAMVRVQPGFHTLIRAGIVNEGEAELLARGTSGDSKRRS
jgi:hypothetical protein